MDCISNKDYRDKNYRKEIEKYVRSHLSDKRWNHTVNVVSEAEKLCQMYGGDMEKCVTAAIFHDVVKELPNEELNALVRKFSFDEKYIDSPNLSHGKIAAALLKHEWGIDDEDIINAVSYHTTGRAGMSKTEKIVFIADAIEPTRVYNGVEAIRKATYEDLDRGCLKSLTDTVEHLKEKGVSYIDEDTLRAREWFEEQIDDFRKERDGNHMNSKDYALLAAESAGFIVLPQSGSERDFPDSVHLLHACDIRRKIAVRKIAFIRFRVECNVAGTFLPLRSILELDYAVAFFRRSGKLGQRSGNRTGLHAVNPFAILVIECNCEKERNVLLRIAGRPFEGSAD